jgi:carbon-monoxide dehydrogenase medium subunit
MSSAATSRLFVEAANLDEALDLLKRRGEDFTVLAGGTDVMVQYLRGDISPVGLLHIRRLPELRKHVLDVRTELGALSTHRELRSNADISRRHPALADAAATVGGRQTQNVGTLAGNVVNASPAADLTPVLLISDTQVELVSAGGRRQLPLDQFVVGRRRTARRPDELVKSMTLEPIGPRSGETYVKLGRRHAMEVAIVGVAVRLTFETDGKVGDVRIALGSVAPKPFRCTDAETCLRGSRLDARNVREAADLLATSAEPIDDARATARYRRRVLPALLTQALETCRRHAGMAGG